MKLGGLMKTTLIDYPGKVACTVFTLGCNFRCPFCHNASLVLPDRYSAEEFSEADFFSFIEKRRGILDGVVVSGGEPTVQNDLTDFLYKIKQYGFDVKLDTNGSSPDKLKEIFNLRLVDYIAMDIKNSPTKYNATVSCNVFPTVQESVNLIMNSGIDYEFRTTAVTELHTVDDFAAISEWICGAKKYFIQSYEASGDILSPLPFSTPTEETLNAFLNAVKKNLPNAELRGV